jgi:hypothetical protein
MQPIIHRTPHFMSDAAKAELRGVLESASESVNYYRNVSTAS